MIFRDKYLIRVKDCHTGALKNVSNAKGRVKKNDIDFRRPLTWEAPDRHASRRSFFSSDVLCSFDSGTIVNTLEQYGSIQHDRQMQINEFCDCEILTNK
jgi:hypothetical protein